MVGGIKVRCPMGHEASVLPEFNISGGYCHGCQKSVIWTFPPAGMNAAPPTPMKFENMDIATLRDQFAMAAMSRSLREVGLDYDLFDLDEIAKNCYAMADAMLEARKQG